MRLDNFLSFDPRRSLLAMAFCVVATPAATQTPGAMADLAIRCALQPAAQSYAGTCQVPCEVNALQVNFDGLGNRAACTSGPRTVTMTLATTAAPGRWLGTMQGVQPEDPTRAEIVPNRSGTGSVARLPFGWFAVQSLQAGPQSMTVVIDARRQVRPTADDLAILDRAIALIPQESAWNKADTRQCPRSQTQLSLFCALMQATTELSGGVHYRQPAMQAVREELNQVDPARIQTHRIMDFNNHPATTLTEVHDLLRRAKARVSQNIQPGQ